MKLSLSIHKDLYRHS